MKELTFEDWWNSQDQHKEKDVSFKEEVRKGWDEASKTENMGSLRGLGPYCEGWNAKIREKKSA